MAAAWQRSIQTANSVTDLTGLEHVLMRNALSKVSLKHRKSNRSFSWMSLRFDFSSARGWLFVKTGPSLQEYIMTMTLLLFQVSSK